MTMLTGHKPIIPDYRD